MSRLSESNVRAVLHGSGTDDFVAAVTVTRDGAVWTAPATGLTRRFGTTERTYTEQDGLPGRIVTALHEDTHGTLWAATTLWVARLVGQRFVPLATRAGEVWSGYQIRSMTSERDGTLWRCDQERGLFRWNDGVIDNLADVLEARKAYIVHADRTGRVWIGFWAGGLAVYDCGHISSYGAEQGLPPGSANAIFEDRSGGLWVATDHELARVEGQRIRTYRTNGFPRPRRGLDGRGRWGGLRHWPRTRRSCESTRIEFETAAAQPLYQLRYRLYGAEDGLPGTVGRPGVPSAAANRGRRTAVRHVCRPRGRRPGSPSRLSAAHARSASTAVSADGRDRGVSQPPLRSSPPRTTAARHHRFHAEYDGRARRASPYSSEGFDADWQHVGDQREASDTNLRPGTLRLPRRGRDTKTPGSKIVPLWTITIQPAFYQTRAFDAIAASSLALLLWFGWRRRVRHIQREFDLVLAERSRLGREIHDTLLQSLVAVALEFDDISEQLGPTRAA